MFINKVKSNQSQTKVKSKSKVKSKDGSYPSPALSSLRYDAYDDESIDT
jgi:hypothetical protein